MRPPWEVADVIRRIGGKFLECYGESLTWAQVKVLAAIVRCQTAALGGHRDQCLRCGYQAISYNSCRNRHWSEVPHVLNEAISAGWPIADVTSCFPAAAFSSPRGRRRYLSLLGGNPPSGCVPFATGRCEWSNG